MHWANPKPSRMLPEVGGSSNLQAQANPQMRRASEGGAALYFGLVWMKSFYDSRWDHDSSNSGIEIQIS